MKFNSPSGVTAINANKIWGLSLKPVGKISQSALTFTAHKFGYQPFFCPKQQQKQYDAD
ncbi:MAG: hypothetical protein MI756_08490 [Chromatiales bacterium]|nr:hypothetical protein [Chromatiales bacterium]